MQTGQVGRDSVDPSHWFKPDLKPTDFAKAFSDDKFACLKQGATDDWAVFRKCMEAKGYSWVKEGW